MGTFGNSPHLLCHEAMAVLLGYNFGLRPAKSKTMQQVLDQVRKVVIAMQASSSKDMLLVQELAKAITGCRAYIEEHEKTDDRGCAQRLVRDLDEILCVLPQYKHLGDKHAAAARHTKKLSEDHLADIENGLKQLIEEDRREKEKMVRDWVYKHPVLGPLRKACLKKSIQKEGYVLLFEKDDEGNIKLLPRSVDKKAVLTRFRPQTFVDDVRLHKQFESKQNLVGAAIIHENKLFQAIGELPPAPEGKDQLHTLLSMSNEAASKPAADYIERNEVLRTLHELARGKQIPKEAYILLFVKGSEGELKIVDKTNEEGRVLTRFWANDFMRKHIVFDTFKRMPHLLGAAVIKERELVHAIGTLPEPAEGRSQLDAVLAASNQAVQRPSLEFVLNNEVLKGLHEYAINEQSAKTASYVMLFARTETGGITVLSLNAAINTGGGKGKGKGPHHRREESYTSNKIPLDYFKSVRSLHETFSKEQQPVIGASVIEDSKKPQVIAAFGRTPLKQSMLAVPENFRRLGIPV